MEFLFDTANLSDVKKYIDYFPITGVTCNPSIILKNGKMNFFEHFRELREITGFERTLHIQATASDAAGILAEAECIHKRIDPEVIIKVPVTVEGMRAIKILKKNGFLVTATVIYTKIQALTAMEAGADYLAIYYNRMENMDIDPLNVISSVSKMIERYQYNAKIIGASFRNIRQINDAFDAGAHMVTMTPEMLYDSFNMPAIQEAVDVFDADWETMFGDRRITDL